MEVIKFSENELDTKIEELRNKGLQNSEIVKELINQGYTVDSFRYDPAKYKWFKNILVVVNREV